nr:hypothetical protein MACL_00003034 [Theileria orientalis]
MNKLLEFIEYYTIKEEEEEENSIESKVYEMKDNCNKGYDTMWKDVRGTNGDNGINWLNSKGSSEGNTTTSMASKEEGTKTTSDSNMASKSSLELLVDINSKFVKVSVSVMKLLSQLDHEILNNYINNEDDAEDIETYYQIMNVDSGLRESDIKTSEDSNNEVNGCIKNNEYSNNSNGNNEMNNSYYCYSKGNGGYNTNNDNYNNITTDNNHGYGNYDTNYGSYKSNNIYYYQLSNIRNYQPVYSTQLAGCKLTNKNSRRGNSSTHRANSNKLNKEDGKLPAATIYEANKGNVKRIVTTFRPQFNSLFQPIPLHNSGSSSMSWNRDNVKCNRTIFQPINSSNNRSNTSYSEGSYSSSSSTYRERKEEINKKVNRDGQLDMYNRGNKELNMDPEGTNMKVSRGDDVCNKERKGDTHEVKGAEVEVEYEREELKGDECYFQVLETELKLDKYSEDDTPILKLMKGSTDKTPIRFKYRVGEESWLKMKLEKIKGDAATNNLDIVSNTFHLSMEYLEKLVKFENLEKNKITTEELVNNLLFKWIPSQIFQDY